MEVSLFGQGLIIGLSIAAPVGPIGLLCIQRTLSNGFFSGWLSGLGAATADLIYGVIAALGLTLVLQLLDQWSVVIQVLGITFLIYLGIHTWRQPVSHRAAQLVNRSGLFRDYLSTFVLTLANPATILAFIGIFSGFQLQPGGEPMQLIAGVFLGSALWWTLLASLSLPLHGRLTDRIQHWINRVAGLTLIALALVLAKPILIELW